MLSLSYVLKTKSIHKHTIPTTLKLFNVTMVVNMSIVIFKRCVKLMELFFVYHALTHLLIMVNLDEKYASLTILFEFY